MTFDMSVNLRENFLKRWFSRSEGKPWLGMLMLAMNWSAPFSSVVDSLPEGTPNIARK